MTQGPSRAAPGFATPAVILGTVAAPGNVDALLRADSTLVAFDTTVPVTQAIGDAAAAGAAAVAARRDHRHGMLLLLLADLPQLPHAIVVKQGADQAVPDSAFTAITWNFEYIDTSGFHDTVTNNPRLTIPTGLGGLYLVTALYYLNNLSATGVRLGRIVTDAGVVIGGNSVVGSTVAFPRMGIVGLARLNAGAYVYCDFYQTSGGSVAVGASESFFGAVRLSS